MEIKAKILEQIKRNEELADFLHLHGGNYEKADEAIVEYLEKFKEWNFDSGLTNNFANCLQMSNVPSHFQQYDFEDIRKLFQSMLKLCEFNLETYLELAHFESAVMDNSIGAENVIDEGIKKAKEKIDELTKLKETIHQGK